MCITCWEDGGSPTVWNPAVAEVTRLVTDLYGMDDCAVGGPLHVVVDDWNLDGPITPYWFGEESAELAEFVTALAAKMTALTVDERLSAMAHHEGFAREGVEV